MFEELATSAGQMVLLTFLLVIFFILLYGVIWVHVAKRAGIFKTKKASEKHNENAQDTTV